MFGGPKAGAGPRFDGSIGQVQQPLHFLQGKGKGKGKGKGPNGGKGFCLNCGEQGHFASKCDKPKTEVIEKGGSNGNGKKGKGVNAIVDVLKAMRLQMPPTNEQNNVAGRYSFVHPLCCFCTACLGASARWRPQPSRASSLDELGDSFEHREMQHGWQKPRKPFKNGMAKIASKIPTKMMLLPPSTQMNHHDHKEPSEDEGEDSNEKEPNAHKDARSSIFIKDVLDRAREEKKHTVVDEDELSLCSLIGGNDELWLPGKDERRQRFVVARNEKHPGR